MLSPRRFWLFSVLILVVVAIVAGSFYFAHNAQAPSGNGVACTADAMLCPDGSYVGRTGPNCAFVCPVPAVNTSTWKTYTNAAFGITFLYPPNWQRSADILSVVDPHVFFGNPLSGKQVYELKVFAYNNPENLSASDYVQQLLANDAMQDASNTVGTAPMMTPQFDEQFATMVGNYPAYELYNVFEFDQGAEQIYVQQNKQMLLFDFPVADDNPNIASPTANNEVVHEILNTMTLDPVVWKFCGGIAAGAFQCPTGYTCQLDGSFPDAGGHCAK